MGKNLTNFERSLQKAYEEYEVPYDSKSWNAIESHLDAAAAIATSNTASYVAAVAATLFLVLASSVAYFSVWNNADSMPTAKLATKGKISVPSNFDKGNGVYTSSDLIELRDESELVDQARPSATLAESSIAEEVQPKKAKENANKASDNSSESITPSVEQATNQTADQPSTTKNYISPQPNSDELSFAADLREACAGVAVSFQLTTGEIKGSYLWNFGDGNFANQPNPEHVYSKPGTYDITLSVTSHEDGVIRSKSIKNMIIINPVPEAQFDWEFVNEAAQAPKVKFINSSERAKYAEWTLGSEGSNEINPELTLAKAGDYPVKLVVSNDYGCVDSIYQYISIEEDFKLLAPEAFSPNGDGLNDTFMPEALKMRDVQFKLTVYDNNQPIFQSEDKYVPWKGILPNGTLARPGKSFPWVVLLTNEEGKEEFYSGTITIIP